MTEGSVPFSELSFGVEIHTRLGSRRENVSLLERCPKLGCCLSLERVPM